MNENNHQKRQRGEPTSIGLDWTESELFYIHYLMELGIEKNLIERVWFRDQSIWMVGSPRGESWPAELLKGRKAIVVRTGLVKRVDATM